MSAKHRTEATAPIRHINITGTLPPSNDRDRAKRIAEINANDDRVNGWALSISNVVSHQYIAQPFFLLNLIIGAFAIKFTSECLKWWLLGISGVGAIVWFLLQSYRLYHWTRGDSTASWKEVWRILSTRSQS